MSLAVLASADPRVVIGQAGELLADDPVGHNVVGLKLADAIRYGEPGRYWIGLLDGVPAGVAVQQPADTPRPPDYFGPGLGVLVAVWQLWNHQRLMWVTPTAATAAAPPIYGLSVGGVINYVLPGRWMLITGPADILALATLLSPPIRRWVASGRPGTAP